MARSYATRFANGSVPCEIFVDASGLTKAGRVPASVKHAAPQKSRANKDPNGGNHFVGRNKGVIALSVLSPLVFILRGSLKEAKSPAGKRSLPDSDIKASR